MAQSKLGEEPYCNPASLLDILCQRPDIGAAYADKQARVSTGGDTEDKMKLHPILFALPLALTACGGDPLAEDIREFNALGEKTVSPEAANDLMSKARMAQTNAEKAKLLGDYADQTAKQAETMGAFKADTPEVKAIAAKVSGGLKKASDGARAGQQGFANDNEEAFRAAAQNMNEGLQEFQAGANELRKLAREKNVDLTP